MILDGLILLGQDEFNFIQIKVKSWNNGLKARLKTGCTQGSARPWVEMIYIRPLDSTPMPLSTVAGCGVN